MTSFFTCGQLPVCDVYGFGGEFPACVVLWGCNVTRTGGSDGMCGGMVQRAIEGAKKVIVVDPRRIGPAEHGWRRSNVNLLFGETDYDPDSGSECLRSALCRVYKQASET